MDALLFSLKVMAASVALTLALAPAVFFYWWLRAGSRIERAYQMEARIKEEWKKYGEAKAELERQQDFTKYMEEQVATYRKQRDALEQEVDERCAECQTLKSRIDELRRLKEAMQRDISALRTKEIR